MSNRQERKKLAAQKREQREQERERERREDQKADAIALVELAASAQRAAKNAVSQEEYEAAKEAGGWFNEMWNQPGRDRKSILAFMLRRIASLVESSFLANAISGDAESAAWNVTGALLGGAEGAASMSQMGVQKADMQYRTARMAADNLYQLAREIEQIDVDLYPDLMEKTKETALHVRKKGVGQSWENIFLLLADADNLVSSAYRFDAACVNGLDALEYRREQAFKKHWNNHRIGLGIKNYIENYTIAGWQHYRRLFHGETK